MIPLVAGALAQRTILHNYFFLDDFLNLYQIENFGFIDYLLTPYSDHFQPTRNAIFYGCAKLFGLSPTPYFGFVLVIHLLIVWLLFRLIARLTGSAGVGCFGATLWAISPRHQETLGWYSVFGQVLVVTALLLIANGILAVAAAHRRPRRLEIWLWYGLALVAATSFGSGIGIAMAVPPMVRLLLDRRSVPQRLPPTISLIAVVPALYVISTITAADAWGSLLPSNLPAISATKVGSVLIYLTDLTASGLATLLFGACADALATPVVAYGLLITLGVALLAAVRSSIDGLGRPITAFVVALLACYGTIAVGRGRLFPDDLALNTIWAAAASYGRYHYLGQLLLAVLLCLALRLVVARIDGRIATALLVAAIALPILIQRRCTTEANDHRRDRDRTRLVVDSITATIAASPAGADVYIDNAPFVAVSFSPTLFPGWAGVFTIFFPDNTVQGRRVHFVETDAATRKAAAQGVRTRTLLVAARP